MDILTLLNNSMKSDDPTREFRSVVKAQLDAGANREALVLELKALRKVVSDKEEDVILEILDFLYGWCAPHMRL